MNIYDVIIIGGGASGCLASIFASKKYKNILIIDKQNKLAKKILVTGNGRCNLSNYNINSEKYNQNIDSFLNQFSVQDTLNFFKSIGLETYFDNENRIYPISNSAKSVVDVLTNAIDSLNIKYELNCEVEDIEKNNIFTIKTNKGQFLTNKLIIATGGNSMLNILEKFNLDIKNIKPSLVSIKTNSTKNLANTRISNVKVSLVNKNNSKLYSENGEVLFKENGISGICIFNISSILARLNEKDSKISIDLLPFVSKDKLTNMLIKRKALNLPINKFFDGIFVNSVAYEILNRAKINENRFSTQLTANEIEKFSQIIKNFDFTIKGLYDNNQVFAGGIKLSSLSSSLESKKIENLYFCGEICDVDGLCGGYNLQWAWTSGKIVGENI